MIIDKKLNFDTELEYQKNGNLVFAQNIVLSNDGLAIQNEPAIVNFLTRVNFDMVGFIACNEEFVLFSSDSKIVRISKYGDEKECNVNWKHCGGEVFGTFTYNVANELIIAISERNPATDCPLKVINLDREDNIKLDDDNLYTLAPNIPKSNMIDIEYVLGNRIKKGKYNFFIKYYVEDIYETSWFPIGVPVFIYDNITSIESKIIDKENIQATGKLNSEGIPDSTYNYNIVYEDFYNEDDEYTNNNVKLSFEINDKLNYTHFRIGYIINTNTGIEGKQIAKQYLDATVNKVKVLINDSSETISVDELTIGVFNLYNVNTMCNYKNRLYLANYKEENRNKDVENISTLGIQVHYDNADKVDTSYVTDSTQDNLDDFKDLRNQWKSKPGRCAVYNFYIHYVYPNGNFTDGIKIGSLDNYSNTLYIGYSIFTNPTNGNHYKKNVYATVDKNTTTDGLLEEYDVSGQYNTLVRDNPELFSFLEAHPNTLWWTIEAEFYATYPDQFLNIETSGGTNLGTVINSKGDVLFVTPTSSEFSVSKLRFSGIRMYPQFVGYFISYEKPEYIQVGEGFLVPVNVSRTATGELDLFTSRKEIASTSWKFYYPEFNIVGGKTNVNKLLHTGTHNISLEQVDVANNSRGKEARGYTLGQNDFVGSDEFYNVNSISIKSPNGYENIGKEGYLRVDFNKSETINQVDTFKSYTAISNIYDLYLSDNKKLISLGYIKYVTENVRYDVPLYNYGIEDVPYNYDFYRCFSSIIFFKSSGVIINQTESNHINAASGEEYYPSSKPESPFYPHIGIVKYWHESHYPLFLKEINQAPETLFYSYYKYSGQEASFKDGSQYQRKALVLSPQYVNDLYKLDPIYYDYTGKLLVNYDETLISNDLEEYINTVRRSDVIQSESIVNSWKYFRPENYKIITENKGAITNITGIGNYLFVHCEHSLFLFDITDSLQTADKNVQLLQPDTFDVAYKEVFTAEKGFGGLQDFTSWICDDFGYVFYDESSRNIYRFDSNQLVPMNDGIDKFIKLYQPNYMFMGNDRFNNRILFNLGFYKSIAGETIIDNIILSYSTITNSWVSTHSYTTADKFINLKDSLYILGRRDGNLTINQFDYVNEKDNPQYNDFSILHNDYSVLPNTSILNTKNDSSFIDVIFVGDNYNKIKVLDFITYIINKDSYDDGYTNLQLEIYTNCCYSGVIDISQERKKVSEYKKPYYDYERWNFNWFRNILNRFDNGEIVNRLTGKVIEYDVKVKRGYDNALMTGKYAVIRFIFKNINKPVFVKDIHAYFKP